MKYIRFLKAPVVRDRKLSALITITSDLGESFLASDAALHVTLEIASGAPAKAGVYAQKDALWKAGMRSLVVELGVPARARAGQEPAQLHVRSKQPTPQPGAAGLAGGFGCVVVPAWSAPLDLRNNVQVARAERLVQRRLPVSGRAPLRVWEEAGESIARHLWDAGLATAAFLDRAIFGEVDGLPQLQGMLQSASSRVVTVVELGSGCGTVGIWLGRYSTNFDVVLTDLPEAEDIVRKNIAENGVRSVAFEALDWEEPIPQTVRGLAVDLIVAADCTYNPDSSPALVRTLTSLSSQSAGAVVVVAMKKRHPSEDIFFELMAEANFAVAAHLALPLPSGGEEEEDEVVDVFEFCQGSSPHMSGPRQ